MKRFTKKILSVVLALTLVVGLSTTAFADHQYKYWTTYFSVNEADNPYAYEGVDCLSFKETSNSFTANINKIGWKIWGGHVDKKISVTKGKTYVVSFKASSSKIDKFVYVKVGPDEALAYSFWIFLPAGKTKTFTKVFKAAASTNKNLTFGVGGDFGDRSDDDAAVRYAVFKRDFKKDKSFMKTHEAKPGDSSSPTVLTVKSFSFSQAPGKVSIKKAKALGKKKVKVQWKKAAGAEKYQVQVGSVKKTTTKTSLKVKAKKKGKQTVKVRAIVGTYKAPWSKAKKVKVK